MYTVRSVICNPLILLAFVRSASGSKMLRHGRL